MISSLNDRMHNQLGLNSSLNNEASQERFLRHFQSINSKLSQNYASATKPKIPSPKTTPSATSSFIDEVHSLMEDNQGISAPITLARPLVTHPKRSVLDRINSINNFFSERVSSSQESQLQSNQEVVMDLSSLLVAISSLPTLLPATNAEIARLQPDQFQIPTTRYDSVRSHQDPEIITTARLGLAQAEASGWDTQKSVVKRVDLILFDIYRIKQLRGLSVNYREDMEQALIELIELIYSDEPEIANLAPSEKFRHAFINVESFVDKEIQGESKISLLKVIFEELHSLKVGQGTSNDNKRKESNKNQFASAQTGPIKNSSSTNNFMKPVEFNKEAKRPQLKHSSAKNSRPVSDKRSVVSNEVVTKLSSKIKFQEPVKSGVASVRRNLTDQWMGNPL